MYKPLMNIPAAILPLTKALLIGMYDSFGFYTFDIEIENL